MFGEPQCPKIEIIRTGRKKRKSENVSQSAYPSSRPPPAPPDPLPISIHPGYTVSPVFCFLQQAGGRKTGGEGCLCGLSGVVI